MLLTICACAALPGIASGASIFPVGPLDMVTAGDDLSCQAGHVNDLDYQFYPPSTTPGDCATFLAVDGVLYAPDFSLHARTATSGLGAYVAFDPVSQTGVEGAGTAADPYRVTTVVDAGLSGLRITETTSYVEGSESYRIDTSVENLSGESRTAVLYHAGDCYASGSDIGFGFTRPEVRTAGCSQDPHNSPARRTVQLAPLSPGSRFIEARFWEVWEQIATQAPLPDTCRCEENVDNGVALSWELSLAPQGTTARSLVVSFTESQQPAPERDSDGDALPDAWETGTGAGADYENLAPLGADPSRRDVFVHVDYVDGCAPPAGWERDAIRVFANQGIALHVDSGPGSLNANGQPWGALSRGGQIGLPPDFGSSDIPSWSALDRLKDQRLVPSNRRRAFHYAAFVRSFGGGDGGISRGAPEADLMVSACSVPSWIRHLDATEYLTTTFVHELGHNLGLRHGGGDDIQGKPSYYSVMNYFWALVGGPTKRGVGALPDFSDSVRPEVDERHVEEKVPHAVPTAWMCPRTTDKLDIHYEFGSGAEAIDWNCNGIRGERGRELNLNQGWDDGTLTQMVGFDDWEALRFDGAGVIGSFNVPLRPDPPLVRELTTAEVGAAGRALARSKRRGKRQLVVSASKRRLRARRVVTVRVQVSAGAKRVSKAVVLVRGARLLGARKAVTDRRGRATLRLRTRRRGDVLIVAKRKRFERGGLVVPVARQKAPKQQAKRKRAKRRQGTPLGGERRRR